MKPNVCSIIAAAAFAGVAVQATPAAAQRVFVAAQGSDANPCTFALPCRTFQHAHDAVAAGGEIDVLDPAGYGAVSINKAISIQGHGFSGISVGAGGNGITISAGASDAVNLNGLLIEGNGVGANGIRFNSGKSLTVENCVVRQMTTEGLSFSPGAGTQTLTVANSYFTGNANSGVLIQQVSGTITAAITRSAFYDNRSGGVLVFGFNGTGTVNVAVSDSAVAGSANAGGGAGVLASSSAGHSLVDIVLQRAAISGNDAGVAASGAGTNIRLAQSSITGNPTAGFKAVGGGLVTSYGDNVIDDNGSNVGSLSSASKQ
jgi:hypothetical protein